MELAYFYERLQLFLSKLKYFLGHFLWVPKQNKKEYMLQQLQMFRSYASISDVNTMQAEF